MDQLNRVNGPINPGQAPGLHNAGAPKIKKPGKGNGALKIAGIVGVALLTVLVILAIVGALYKSTQGIGAEIKEDKYQAVFLNSADGQVYFGKLNVFNKEYYKLTDIYYVRVQQVQPNPNEQAQQNISLAKLGSEIHGPEDVMYIQKDDVMFWENLKDDGQVVTAIKKYKQDGEKSDNTQTQNQAPASDNNNQ